MARLTNQEIRNMSINEADAYTDAHPAAAIKQTKKAAKNGFKTGILFAEPETI